MNRDVLIEVDNNNLSDYTKLFSDFGHFENLLRFIINYTKPIILVNDLEHPTCALLKHGPANFIKGDPNEVNVHIVLNEFKTNSWIVPCSTEWDNYIITHFDGRYEVHNRVLFDSRSLDLTHIISLKKDLPNGMVIVPISQSHIDNKKGMIYQDLISKFFTGHDFLLTGKGFALMDKEVVIGYAASDNPIIGNDLELMFRVGYDNYTKYRGFGYGIQLCVHFIEYCLKNDLIPSWDAHNEISAHIAIKLGYKEKKKWNMFHIL